VKLETRWEGHVLWYRVWEDDGLKVWTAGRATSPGAATLIVRERMWTEGLDPDDLIVETGVAS
jgi:hypothetical protein